MERIEAGTFALEMRTMSVRHTLAAVLNRMHSWAQVEEVLLTLECDPALPAAVIGDHNRLAQVRDALPQPPPRPPRWLHFS